MRAGSAASLDPLPMGILDFLISLRRDGGPAPRFTGAPGILPPTKSAFRFPECTALASQFQGDASRKLLNLGSNFALGGVDLRSA